jgi:hypothetical protein
MKNRILILTLSLFIQVKSQEKETWYHYTFEPMIEQKNGERTHFSDDEGYRWFHLKVIGMDLSKNYRMWSYPVKIKGNDTLFSASDGGFLFGKGNYRRRQGKIFISGKYTQLEYIVASGDSTFKDTLISGGPKILMDSRGNNYNRTSPSLINDRWKIELEK